MKKVDVNKLKPHKLNQKIYGDEEISQDFLDSIDEFGILVPLKAKPSNTIISGHRRWKGAKKLGLDKIPVETITFSSKLAEREAILTYNKQRDKTYSQKMKESEEWEDIEKEKAKKRQDQTEKLERNEKGQLKPVSRNSDEQDKQTKGRTDEKVANKIKIGGKDTYRKAKKVWDKAKGGDKEAQKKVEEIDNDEESIHGAYKDIKRKKRKREREKEIKKQDQKEVGQSKYNPKIAQTDYDSFLKEVNGKSFDLLVTDPPYMTDVDNVKQFANSWVDKALAKVKDSGQAYICTGAYPDEIETYLEILNHHDRFDLTDILVWTYRNTLGPQPKDKYHLNWQSIFYLRGPDAAEINSEKMKEKFAVQDINAPDGRQANRFHRWQKPDELAERFIKHSTKEDDKVLDPFAGTGTFLVAATKYNRNAVGCDIDDEILEIAKERGCKIK